MRVEFSKLKDELKLELKSSRESFERNIRNDIREVRNEQEEMVRGIEHAHAVLADLGKRLEDAIAKNSKLAKENEKLREKCTTSDKSNQELEKRLNLAEQYSRCSNLEIQGIVKQEGGNVAGILAKLGDTIYESITKSDTESGHRVPTRHPDNSNIVVQFRLRAKRFVALQKAKKMRLTNKDLGLDD